VGYRIRPAGIAAAAVLAILIPVGIAPQARAQAAAQSHKKVKDQAEYEVFNAVTKEADGKKKIELLQQWKARYPDSDYREDRYVLLIQTYAQLSQAPDILSTARELFSQYPKNLLALYWLATLVPGLGVDDAASLDLAASAGRGLIAAEKPAETTPEDWAKSQADLPWRGHKALGWVAWKRKDLAGAEREFLESLQLNPKQAEVSSWLGAVIYQTRKPERQGEVLFHYARASVLAPSEGGMPDAQRKVTEEYLERAFASYHGPDPAEVVKLKDLAKASVLPPPGFKIESAAEIQVRKAEELRRANPQLELWLNIKRELAGPRGEQYFESSVRNADVPKLRGTLLAARPPVKPKELVLGLESPTVAEVTLRLDTPLAGKPRLGSEVEFQGVASAFSRTPFMLTFDVPRTGLAGPEMEGAPAAKKPVSQK
jgi:hypothetical protein